MHVTERRLVTYLSLVLMLLLFGTAAQADEAICVPIISSDDQIRTLKLENELLTLKVRQLEDASVISVEHLRLKKVQRLKEIAANVKLQRQTTSDFEGFVTWMSANLAGYNRYIQAGSYAAVIGRMLPIPYAGQASIFTKFVTQFTVALNAASVSITNYLDSSRKFLAMTAAITTATTADEKAISEAALFADRQLLKDMNEAQARLAAVSDLSSGALAFLQSLNHYVSGTDEYWNKAKGLFKKDVDPREKSYISESTNGLKTEADRFNGKLKSFQELGSKETASVKTLTLFDELIFEATTGVSR